MPGEASLGPNQDKAWKETLRRGAPRCTPSSLRAFCSFAAHTCPLVAQRGTVRISGDATVLYLTWKEQKLKNGDLDA